jgi:UDP-N-acetylmuramoylalanine-D-glutamate ligase
MRFEALPHRMQTVGTFDGITYIDDSKATSISALIAGVTMAFSRLMAFSHLSRINTVKFSNFQGSLPNIHPVALPNSPLSTINYQLPHLRLIAGGLPKGDDPAVARDCLAKCVEKVYLIGQSATLFEEAWKDIVLCEVCNDLQTAVSRARSEAGKGDCVLLSPGTASFDQFKSYGERGDRFADFAKLRISG